MTVPAGTRRMPEYVGNDVTTDLPFTFYVPTSDAIAVIQVEAATDAQEVLVFDTDYTIEGLGVEAGGTVLLADPIATGYSVYLIGDTPITQPTDFKNQSTYQGNRVERALDREVIQIQELENKALVATDLVTLNYDAQGRDIEDIGAAYVDELYINGVLVVPEDMAFSLPDPTGNALELLRVDSGGTAYETKTITELDLATKTNIATGNTAAVIRVATAAAMKALTGMIDGARVSTSGYSVEGVGFGSYIYDSSLASFDEFKHVESTSIAGGYTLLDETPNPMQAGAIGDGVTDDTDAIRAAIASGLPLGWGDSTRTYRITEEIAETVTAPIDWTSSSATIFHDPPAHTYSCMTLTLPEASHKISGVLKVDVNQNANVGVKFVPEVNGTDFPDLVLEDLHISNTYRTIDFDDGDALFVVGSFRKLNIIRPVITNSHMATGAGVPGVYGIFGITTSRNGAHSTISAVIEDPFIENVWSDDPSYTQDQDGIRMFTRYGGSGTGGLNNAATVKITGGYIKQVRGRSIKVQTENGLISGVTLFRSALANGGASGTLTVNADIEVQTGGCTVSDIEFQYVNYTPFRVVRGIQADETVDWASPHIISNIRGVVSGSYAPEELVLFTVIDTAESLKAQFIASNVNVVSETEIRHIANVGLTSPTTSATFTAMFTNLMAPLYDEVLQLTNGATLTNDVSIFGVQNTGSAAVPLASTYAQYRIRAGGICAGVIYNIPVTTAVSAPEITYETDNWILSRNSTTQTVTLPEPATNIGRVLNFKNIGTQQVDSAWSDVVPIGTAVAGTAIFAAATAGTWCQMTSDGTNWVIIQRG